MMVGESVRDCHAAGRRAFQSLKKLLRPRDPAESRDRPIQICGISITAATATPFRSPTPRLRISASTSGFFSRNRNHVRARPAARNGSRKLPAGRNDRSNRLGSATKCPRRDAAADAETHRRANECRLADWLTRCSLSCRSPSAISPASYRCGRDIHRHILLRAQSAAARRRNLLPFRPGRPKVEARSAAGRSRAKAHRPARRAQRAPCASAMVSGVFPEPPVERLPNAHHRPAQPADRLEPRAQLHLAQGEPEPVCRHERPKQWARRGVAS